MILQQSFEHGAHIGGGLEVAVLQQALRLQPGPVGDHATAFERSAGEQHDGGGAVVRAISTVDVRRAAEFGDEHHHGLAPRRSHVFSDGGESVIERAQQLRQPASRDAFIVMCVPTVERERADARTVGLRQELRGGTNGLGEIGTQLREVGAGNLADRLLVHAAGRRNCGELRAAFKDAREVDIGVPIKVQQSQDRVVACRQNSPRPPRQHRRWSTNDQRRHRSDGKGPAAVRTDAVPGRKARQQTVEPPAVGRAWLFDAALEHVLAIEMRALAIGRGSGTTIASFALNIRCRLGIAGLSAKKSSSLSADVLLSSVSALSPRSETQSGSPTGATVASPSSAPRSTIVRKRGSRPSARASFGRCAQANSVPEASSGSRRDGACRSVMIYLRRNSGAISSRASACARLSARATVLRVSADASGPSPVSTSATGSNRSATRPAKLLAMSTLCDRPWIHVDSLSGKPFGAGGRHSGSPSNACPDMTRPTAHCAPVRRSADIIHSDGRLSFVRSDVHDSSAAISVLANSFRLPSLSVKLFASLSTSDGGGLSATKYRANLYATCRAVAGCRARSASTARP